MTEEGDKLEEMQETVVQSRRKVAETFHEIDDRKTEDEWMDWVKEVEDKLLSVLPVTHVEEPLVRMRLQVYILDKAKSLIREYAEEEQR